MKNKYTLPNLVRRWLYPFAKRVVSKIHAMNDWLGYYRWYLRATDKKIKSDAKIEGEFRRHIHSLEISTAISKGKNDHGIRSAKILSHLIKKFKTNPDLNDVVKEAQNCLLNFIKTSALNTETMRSFDVLVEEASPQSASLAPIIVDYQNFSDTDTGKAFSMLVSTRRSVRSYCDKPVDKNIVISAVSDALNTPSACNKRPWKVYLIDNTSPHKETLLDIQNNSAEWRGEAHLLLITVNLEFYENSSEKNAPFIDGGLFGMSLILGLHARGLGTCALNLNLETSKLRAINNSLKINTSEVPIMLVAYGYPSEAVKVPRGIRRHIDEVIHELD
jgi:nitroreductase